LYFNILQILPYKKYAIDRYFSNFLRKKKSKFYFVFIEGGKTIVEMYKHFNATISPLSSVGVMKSEHGIVSYFSHISEKIKNII